MWIEMSKWLKPYSQVSHTREDQGELRSTSKETNPRRGVAVGHLVTSRPPLMSHECHRLLVKKFVIIIKATINSCCSYLFIYFCSDCSSPRNRLSPTLCVWVWDWIPATVGKHRSDFIWLYTVRRLYRSVKFILMLDCTYQNINMQQTAIKLFNIGCGNVSKRQNFKSRHR